VQPAERERHPNLIGCINCGLCALAAGRIGKTRLPDLASSYMRLYARLGEASSDVEGDMPALEAAASACPVGVPLDEVAAIVRRIAEG
jgi:succinate dehydrogenase/fumarate reductase-like Fe-S protein